MNLRKIGYQRDREIVEVTESRRALETEQVRVLLFSEIKTGLRKAQERLKRLSDKGKLNCYTGARPYIYYTNEYKQLQHIVGTNWIRLWFERCQPDWRGFKVWDYEQTYPGILRADGFAHTLNRFTKEHEFWFVEMDRGTNAFNKVELYNRLYNEVTYFDRWWAKLAKRFPKVFVVTVSPTRLVRIQEIIENENTENIRFEVHLLDDIRREVLATCKQS